MTTLELFKEIDTQRLNLQHKGVPAHSLYLGDEEHFLLADHCRRSNALFPMAWGYGTVSPEGERFTFMDMKVYRVNAIHHISCGP